MNKSPCKGSCANSVAPASYNENDKNNVYISLNIPNCKQMSRRNNPQVRRIIVD